MICARFGGDEFIAIGKKDENETSSFEERLTAKLKEINSRNLKPYDVSASIGTVLKTLTKDDHIDDLIRLADDKMYTAKKAKKRYS